jgi:single-strand DNA-binding protein
MPNLNLVVVAGHLGKDAEQKFGAGGGSVVKFTVAVSSKGKGDAEQTEWVPVVAFGATGESLMDRLTKGAGVTVTGRFRTSSWMGEGGKKQYRTEVVADSIAIFVKDGGRVKAQEPAAAQPEYHVVNDTTATTTHDDDPF